jgi:DNA primase
MEIQELKTRLSIVDVAGMLQIHINKQGRALCPFHADHSPSLQFSKEKNICTCFSSSCSAGTMDIIGLTEKKLGLSTHEALLQLTEWAGAGETKELALNGKKVNGSSNVAVNGKESPPYEKLMQVFAANLKKSEKAKAYLTSRGLKTDFPGIGYNESGWPQMKTCIIFPLKEKSGQVSGLYGRSVIAAGHYYSKNRKGLYPSYPDKTTRHLLLTESIIDALTLLQLPEITQHYTVLACYGTNGLTAEHQTAIQELAELESITLLFDGDEAGTEGARRTAALLHELRPQLSIFGVPTPDGEDINSLAVSHEPEIFTHLLEQKSPFSFSPETTEKIQSNTLNTDNPQYLVFRHAELLLSVLGGIRMEVADRLRVTLKIEIHGSKSPLHSLRHSVDLYHDDQVDKLIRKAAERLEVGTRTIQLAIAELTEALEEYRQTHAAQKKPPTLPARLIPEDRKKKAIRFMQREDYLRQVNELIGKAGVVGEEINRLILWITYATRKRADPLHVICLGASGTGKTYLQEKVSDLIPEEDKISGTAISENALYYAQNLNLSQKLFIIEDLEGAGNILYALRELQTKRMISKMVTQKDVKGNLRTEIVTVRGPICLSATTTKERLYEDNANRCLLIYLDGSTAQQEAIMEDQRKRSAGRIDKAEQAEVKEFLRDLQALYQPVAIRNPYAEQLRIPGTVFKPLRTNSHYLAFIEGITFCNQFQRKVYTDEQTGEQYINTTIEDIKLANTLMKEVLLAKSDELTKACRSFFEILKTHLSRQHKSSFYRSEVRGWMRINPNNLKYYLGQLQQYGYLKVVGGNKYKQGYEYEVSDLQEYERLSGTLLTALDEALLRITPETTPESIHQAHSVGSSG